MTPTETAIDTLLKTGFSERATAKHLGISRRRVIAWRRGGRDVARRAPPKVNTRVIQVSISGMCSTTCRTVPVTVATHA